MNEKKPASKTAVSRIAARLVERFAFKKEDSVLIVQEVLIGLGELAALEDKLLIPNLGTLIVKEGFKKEAKRFSFRLRKWLIGPLTYYSFRFKPNELLTRKMKARKMGHINSIYNKNPVRVMTDEEVTEWKRKIKEKNEAKTKV